MIQTSQAYREAIVGSPRAIELFAVVDISDPDKQFLPVTNSAEAPWSKKEQLHNYDLTAPARIATLERNRWLGNGTFDLFSDNYIVPGEVGYASEAVSGSSGAFPSPFPWVQLNFSGVRILQAFSLFFDGDPVDGVPMDFTVEIKQGSTVYFTEEITDNTKADVQFKGFTVYDPESIRLTVKKWSLPSRRVRLVEMTTGVFERWTGDDLSEFSATLQGQFSCLSLPYGSVNLAMDNADRRFEPRKKDSIFQSLEERQSVDLYIGCQTDQGMERIKIGVFYQAGDGWKTSDNSLSMKWYLVDIIGLVSNRTFIPPASLPTTLGGWLKAVVSQLGDAFVNLWHADPAYANKAVTANSLADVTGKKCGDIIRWACQASGTWPRADQSTGRLTAEPLWNQGNKYDLDNLESYPTMKANENLAALIFRLADENGTEYVVSGNSTTSEKTVTIINPFIHTSDQALAAARLILAQYGGNLIELTGRGDPSGEIGDVATVWLDESSATTARVMMQSFQFQDGVLQGCRVTGLQADGSYLYTEYAILNQDEGDWTAPDGVTKARIVLSDGGQGGGYGKPGYFGASGNIPGIGTVAGYGDPGQDGQGGKVWYGTVNLNPGQVVHYKRGQGGAAATVEGGVGEIGQPSVFGAYSSENGTYYPNGYTDIANGNTFCRTGVAVPLPGTGDGGKGGVGGDPGEGYWKELFYPDGRSRGWDLIETKPPGPGHPGAAGATGFIMVTWDKPDKGVNMGKFA